MKKLYLPVLVLVMVALFVTLNGSVSAVASSTLAGGGWLGSGEAVTVDLTGTTYPSWLQLADTQGFKVTSAQQICHPFQGGQFAWVADIRLKNGSEWISVPTTQGWMPDEEGTYMACATVSGWDATYAIFAWFDPTRVTKTGSVDLGEEICQYDNWEIYSWWHDDHYPWDEGYSLEVYLGDSGEFPLGKTVTYEILGEYPISGFDIPRTGSTTSWYDGAIYATFTDFIYDELPEPGFVRSVKVSTEGCTYTLTWNSNDTYD